MFDTPLHPATREMIGIVVYLALILFATTTMIVLRRRAQAPRSIGHSLVIAASGIGIAALVGWTISAIVNPIFHADFCVYLILGVATVGGVLMAAFLAARRIPLRPSSVTMLLVLATIGVLAIPLFLLGA